VTVESIILHLAINLCPDLQAFPSFHLMILAIAGAHGGHALAIQRRHVARYTSSQDQGRTNQQRAKSHRRRSKEIPVHVSFLRKESVVCASPCLAGCDSRRWCVSGALSTPIALSKLHATPLKHHHFFCRVSHHGSLTCYFFLTYRHDKNSLKAHVPAALSRTYDCAP